MFLSNQDYEYLCNLLDYLKCEDYDKNCDYHKEMINNLEKLIKKLELKKIEKNKLNTKRIAEKRKIDKNYARKRR